MARIEGALGTYNLAQFTPKARHLAESFVIRVPGRTATVYITPKLRQE